MIRLLPPQSYLLRLWGLSYRFTACRAIVSPSHHRRYAKLLCCQSLLLPCIAAATLLCLCPPIDQAKLSRQPIAELPCCRAIAVSAQHRHCYAIMPLSFCVAEASLSLPYCVAKSVRFYHRAIVSLLRCCVAELPPSPTPSYHIATELSQSTLSPSWSPHYRRASVLLPCRRQAIAAIAELSCRRKAVASLSYALSKLSRRC